MDAVPVESDDSGRMPYAGAPAESAKVTYRSLQFHAFPVQDGDGETVVYGTGTGKTERYMQFILDSLMANKGPKRLSDVTDQARQARDLLDRLDDESANATSASQSGLDRTAWDLNVDVVGFSGAPVFSASEFESGFRAHLDEMIRADGGKRRRPAGLIVDQEAGAHWRALPVYALRPFVLRACCAAAVPESVSTMVSSPEPTTAAPAPPEDYWACVLLYIIEEYPHHVGFGITTHHRRLLRDCWEALRRFLLALLLARLDRMAVTLLAALSHLAQTPTFLFVMIATARHYGRRGDSNGHFLPAPALQPTGQQGAVCLAA